MGAKIIGFLATLMLSIPLAAIGLMAVFGIPQLVPANGDSTNTRDQVIRGVRDVFNWSEKGETNSSQANAQLDDAPQFGEQSPLEREPLSAQPGPHGQGQYGQGQYDHNPYDRDRPNQYAQQSTSGATSSSIFDVPPQRALSSRQVVPSGEMTSRAQPRHWSEIPSMGGSRAERSAALQDPSTTSIRPGVSSMTAGLQNGRSFQKEGVFDAQAPLLTWRQASLRLTELGVKNYHLERGAAEGTFLFVCTFSPGDAPHVVHRFESETDDPLLAVNQVLQQVDRWMRSRYAAANFPSKPQSLSLSSESRLR